jgi:hypothetical protein
MRARSLAGFAPFDRQFTFHPHFKSLYTSRQSLEKSLPYKLETCNSIRVESVAKRG